MRYWQLRAKAIGKSQERRRQRQSGRSRSWTGCLTVGKRIGLEGIQLNSLGFDIPTAHLHIVMASNPSQTGSRAPVRVLAKCRTANAKIAAAAGVPVCQAHEQAFVLV